MTGEISLRSVHYGWGGESSRNSSSFQANQLEKIDAESKYGIELEQLTAVD